MIRISTGYNLADVQDASMFEDRRRLFVEMMGWDVPVTNGRFEIDQFDGPDALYITEFGDEGAHLGSLRLLPSSGPHILADLFAGLCEHGVPRGPGIYEITRLCLPSRLGSQERLRVRNRLISAMVDYALDAGIHCLTGVVRPGFRTSVLAMGWKASPLGPVRTIDGMALGAFRIEVAADTPARLARNGIYTAVASLAPVAA
ncbi:acyl-homoserine-lactone synthase [Sphingobium subterraneum]|uniref:Acyl-homoserine-lactone synthase n=1 Tax=Sphingobium subterraneum TaxID=627688 RepID=A0A841J3E6_9SPHN|nr:acyl-homoserine-lactone synthase [Sphingobium subterraneum]MBB6125210.1 acyl-homoserine lactone synthase [Sphingobium subterraneum]